MSNRPEYTKKYPCPHCDVTKYGTAQLLAHIRDKHTDKAVKTTPQRWKPPLISQSTLVIGAAVTVIYQIHENAQKGVPFMVEHGIEAFALFILLQVLVAQIVRRF